MGRPAAAGLSLRGPRSLDRFRGFFRLHFTKGGTAFPSAPEEVLYERPFGEHPNRPGEY